MISLLVNDRVEYGFDKPDLDRPIDIIYLFFYMYLVF